MAKLSGQPYKDHSPFKRCKLAGEGPRGRTNKATDRWDCKCHKEPDAEGREGTCEGFTVCDCKRHTPDGRVDKTKTVRMDLAAKCKYQKEYKAWVAGRRNPQGRDYSDAKVREGWPQSGCTKEQHPWKSPQAPKFTPAPKAPEPVVETPQAAEEVWVPEWQEPVAPPTSKKPTRRSPKKKIVAVPGVVPTAVEEAVQKPAARVRRKAKAEPVQGWERPRRRWWWQR